MRRKLCIAVLLWFGVSLQFSCAQPKRVAQAHPQESYPLQHTLTELNNISREIQGLAKEADTWSDTATILLVNELIIEITNLLLINKLSRVHPSLVGDQCADTYANDARVALEFIRETIKKNYKGINILSHTHAIERNKAITDKLEKADGIIQESIVLLDKEIQALGR